MKLQVCTFIRDKNEKEELGVAILENDYNGCNVAAILDSKGKVSETIYSYDLLEWSPERPHIYIDTEYTGNTHPCNICLCALHEFGVKKVHYKLNGILTELKLT